MVSRVATGLVNALGCPEFVVQSAREYEDLAAAWCNNQVRAARHGNQPLPPLQSLHSPRVEPLRCRPLTQSLCRFDSRAQERLRGKFITAQPCRPHAHAAPPMVFKVASHFFSSAQFDVGLLAPWYSMRRVLLISTLSHAAPTASTSPPCSRQTPSYRPSRVLPLPPRLVIPRPCPPSPWRIVPSSASRTFAERFATFMSCCATQARQRATQVEVTRP